MKYAIAGIDSNRTISKINVTDTYILVEYMDGTNDVFEKNEFNLDNIKNVMMSQAKKYSKNGSKTEKQTKLLRVVMYTGAGALALIGILDLFNPVFTAGYLSMFSFITSAVVLVVEKFTTSAKLRDIKKYRFYLTNKELLEEQYQNIKNKEAQLTMSKVHITEEEEKSIDITKLDSTRIGVLREMCNKADRYNEIIVSQKTYKK